MHLCVCGYFSIYMYVSVRALVQRTHLIYTIVHIRSTNEGWVEWTNVHIRYTNEGWVEFVEE